MWGCACACVCVVRARSGLCNTEKTSETGWTVRGTKSTSLFNFRPPAPSGAPSRPHARTMKFGRQLRLSLAAEPAVSAQAYLDYKALKKAASGDGARLVL